MRGGGIILLMKEGLCLHDSSLVLDLPLYKLDGASFMSKDAYGHLAAVTGALWTPRGREFDADDDKIVVPDHDSLDIADGLTLEGWIRVFNTGNSSILGKATTIWTETSYTLQVWSNEQPAFDLSSDGGSPHALAAKAISLNVWYHIVGTFKRPDRVLYINGLESASDSWDNDIHVGTSDLYIGKYAGDSDTLDGMIGEVRIYNRALTPLEIQGNYLATKWRYQ